MSCRLCREDAVVELIDFGRQPIVHHLLKTKSERYDKYLFRLGFCEMCGFLQLIECISPEILYKNYFTISGWKNQPHVPRLIEVLQGVSGVDFDHSILDIGCNDGSFLIALENAGYVNLHGIEPTMDSFNIASNKGLSVYNGFFGEDVAKNTYGKDRFDIVITRYVLEHIVDLADFLKGISLIIRDSGILIIEVPDSEWNLDYLDYALWEEHVNYFTINTLRMLLETYGFSIVHYETTLFSGKALTVYCEKRQKTIKNVQYKNYDLKKIHKYGKSWQPFKENLHNFLETRNRPIVMYGCGARSSNFINFTEIHNMVDFFIDDQGEKQNLYVPGCNLKITPWHEAYSEKYTMLLGVNTENEYKVIEKRKLHMSNVFSTTPPSTNLPMFWKNIIYD